MRYESERAFGRREINSSIRTDRHLHTSFVVQVAVYVFGLFLAPQEHTMITKEPYGL
ncbi:hypothetical protein KDA_75620 [Dictyobacter alpinus]|uniref:Uncharacterized protein n=1 Tax=Dictyobacter alpinus TaxID=2014873 RepID=A0A402BL36_9CHLR|nr:hypothetical protein KDA_75620 [Dictyobacter alpinus]